MEDLSVRVVKFLMGLAVVAGLLWVLHASGAPGWVKGVFDVLLLSAFGDRNWPRRRADDGRHPFSSDDPPERG